MHLVDGQAVEVEDGVVTLVLVAAPSEEVFWAKAAFWSEAQHHAFHFEIVQEVASRESRLTSLTTSHIHVSSFWISFSSVDSGAWRAHEIVRLSPQSFFKAFAHSQHHLA